MDCSICCAPTTTNTMSCPSCAFSACQPCHQRFILERIAEPCCMSCRKPWSREFVLETFDNRWAKSEFLGHMARLMLEREKMRLPAAQAEASRKVAARALRVQLTKLPTQDRLKARYGKAWKHNEQALALMEERRALMRQIDDVLGKVDANVTVKRLQKAPEDEKKTHVMRCPVEGCKGYVEGAGWTCEMCNAEVCERCRVVKGSCHVERAQSGSVSVHVCKQGDIDNAQAIAADTRPCPKCYVPIFKAGGCDQMWCPLCHTTFSYNTGALDKGPIHNPVYYEYLASRTAQGGMADINLENLACGEVPDDILVVPMLREVGVQPETVRKVMRMAQYRMHVVESVLRECELQLHDGDEETHADLRVRYLTGDLTEERWHGVLLHRLKRQGKVHAFHQLYTMLLLVINDVYRRMYAACVDMCRRGDRMGGEGTVRGYLKEFREVLRFKEEGVERVCRVHGGSVPRWAL